MVTLSPGAGRIQRRASYLCHLLDAVCLKAHMDQGAFFTYFLLFVWVLQLHICVCATPVPGTPVGRKVSDPLVLELRILVIHHVAAGN